MREYISEENKPMKKSTRVVALIAGAGLVALGVYIWSIYTVLVGAVILLAMALNKKTALTDEGLVVTYDVVLYKYREVWPYEDIQEIHKELSKDRTKYALHVMKDVMSRRLIYPVRQTDEVIEFVLEHNPKIHIADVD